jgi:hypothetical protein
MSAMLYRKTVPSLPSFNTILLQAIKTADSVSLVADVHRVADEQYKQAIRKRENALAHNDERAIEYAKELLEAIDDNPDINPRAILSALADCCSNKQLDSILKRLNR